MPVQDLTPQLRTRLSRVERGVGWFVMLATLVLVGGFGYYIYHTAREKGWFLIKVPYFTFVRDATGLRVGDPVRLMGFEVGEIVQVEGTPAGRNWFTENDHNVFVRFRIREPYYGYIWTDSRVRIGTGDLLGNRIIEVTKGTTGEVTVASVDPIMILKRGTEQNPDYVPVTQETNGYWIRSIESPPLSERLDQIASQVQDALPGILTLTNQIAGVLTNSASMTADASLLMQQAQPILTNLAIVSATLTNGNGVLGELLIPTNINMRLDAALAAASDTMATADTNLAQVAAELTRSLEHLSNLTSNLNAQVQANDQIVSELSSAIVAADEFIQGLRTHWFLRRAFRTNAPSSEPPLIRTPPAGPRQGKYQGP